ncbi:MAG: hypothetical protein AAB295_11445, partial [Chloroflexota bacterium]
PESHGSKAGYVIDREHAEARMLLGEFARLDGASTVRPAALAELEDTMAPDGDAPAEDGGAPPVAAGTASGAPGAAPRKRTRRGSRGGRNRRGGRGRNKTTTAPGGAAAD